MRIYCVVNRSDLELLNGQGVIASDVVRELIVFAQTQQWILMQDETDSEVLDEEILQKAADAGTQPGFVLVAQASDVHVSEQNPELGLVQVSMPIRAKDVAAFFQVDQNGELSWFGPTELPVLLDLG
jgi:hypothetical protein